MLLRRLHQLKPPSRLLRQTAAALANVMGCLKEAGVDDLKALVKVTVYLTDVANLAEVSCGFPILPAAEARSPSMPRAQRAVRPASGVVSA